MSDWGVMARSVGHVGSGVDAARLPTTNYQLPATNTMEPCSKSLPWQIRLVAGLSVGGGSRVWRCSRRLREIVAQGSMSGGLAGDRVGGANEAFGGSVHRSCRLPTLATQLPLCVGR
jgi:hypothetical protein